MKQHAGVIVTVGREGDPEVIRGLLREKDRKAMAALQKVPGSPTQGARDDGPDDSAEHSGSGERRASECSDGLTKRLAAHRTVALQVMLSRNTGVALASLTHVLVQCVFGEAYQRGGSALQITPQPQSHVLQSVADDLKESAAWKVVEASRLACRERLPEQQRAWLGWLIALPQGELLDLLAFYAASTLNALPSSGAASEANVPAEAVALDMADW